MPKWTWIEWPVACWQEETNCSIIKRMIHRLRHLIEACEAVTHNKSSYECTLNGKTEKDSWTEIWWHCATAIFAEKMTSQHIDDGRQKASGFPNLSITVKAFYDVAYRVLLAYVWQWNCGIPGRKRGSNGGSILTEPLLCCFIPRGLIHWMCKDDGVTIGDQMGLTTGWKCKECLLNWCSWDEERGEGEQRSVKRLSERCT